MVVYPLTRTEQRIVRWGGRALMFFALVTTMALGAISLVAS